MWIYVFWSCICVFLYMCICVFAILDTHNYHLWGPVLSRNHCRQTFILYIRVYMPFADCTLLRSRGGGGGHIPEGTCYLKDFKYKIFKQITWFSNSLRKRSPLHLLHLYLRGCTLNSIFLINCFDQNILKKPGSKKRLQVSLTPINVKTINIKGMNLGSPKKYVKKCM